MEAADPLMLHEEILLLVLRDEEAGETRPEAFRRAIGAALLAELWMDGRVGIESCGIGPVGPSSGLTLAAWIERCANDERLRGRVAEGLCRRGVLARATDREVYLFTRRRYPELDPKPERELIGRMRRAIFASRLLVEPRTAFVVSLAKIVGILDGVFGTAALGMRRERIAQLAAGTTVGFRLAEILASVHTREATPSRAVVVGAASAVNA